ncbi:MAG TPA: hypothetical protein VF549_13575, partial [Solirubrobacteraceae bacterium]
GLELPPDVRLSLSDEPLASLYRRTAVPLLQAAGAGPASAGGQGAQGASGAQASTAGTAATVGSVGTVCGTVGSVLSLGTAGSAAVAARSDSGSAQVRSSTTYATFAPVCTCPPYTVGTVGTTDSAQQRLAEGRRPGLAAAEAPAATPGQQASSGFTICASTTATGASASGCVGSAG